LFDNRLISWNFLKFFSKWKWCTISSSLENFLHLLRHPEIIPYAFEYLWQQYVPNLRQSKGYHVNRSKLFICIYMRREFLSRGLWQTFVNPQLRDVARKITKAIRIIFLTLTGKNSPSQTHLYCLRLFFVTMRFKERYVSLVSSCVSLRSMFECPSKSTIETRRFANALTSIIID